MRRTDKEGKSPLGEGAHRPSCWASISLRNIIGSMNDDFHTPPHIRSLCLSDHRSRQTRGRQRWELSAPQPFSYPCCFLSCLGKAGTPAGHPRAEGQRRGRRVRAVWMRLDSRRGTRQGVFPGGQEPDPAPKEPQGQQPPAPDSEYRQGHAGPGISPAGSVWDGNGRASSLAWAGIPRSLSLALTSTWPSGHFSRGRRRSRS